MQATKPKSTQQNTIFMNFLSHIKEVSPKNGKVKTELDIALNVVVYDINTWVNNYYMMLHNIQEKCRSHV